MKLFSRLGKKSADDATTESDIPADAQAGDENTPKKGSQGLTLVKFHITTAVIAALVVAAAGFMAYRIYTAQIERAKELESIPRAERIAAQLSGRLQALTELVETVAGEAHEGEAQLEQRLQMLQEVIPNVVRLRVVGPDELEPDTTTVPSLSYACLDLVRQAESGKRPGVEVHKLGTRDQHIDLVRSIKDADGTAGTLLLSLDTAILSQWLKPNLPAGSYVELIQSAGGGSTLLVAAGDSVLKANHALHSARVAGSAWELHYWERAQLAAKGDQGMVFLALVAGAALLVAIIVLVFAVMADRLVNGDLMRLMSLVVSLFQGKQPRAIAVKMAEMRHSVQALEQVYRQTERAKSKKKKEVALDRVPDEELPPPDPMFISQSAVAVSEESEEVSGEMPPPTPDEATAEQQQAQPEQDAGQQDEPEQKQETEDFVFEFESLDDAQDEKKEER